MRFRFTHLLLLIVGLRVICLLAGCNSKTAQTVPQWPVASEVEGITATVFQINVEEENPTAFEVPVEYVPAIMRVFDTPEYIDPIKFDYSVATLQFRCKDGRVLNVDVVSYGKNKLLFSVDGVLCVRGGNYKSLSATEEIYTAESPTVGVILNQLQYGKLKAAAERIEKLDISAGRKPPKP